MLREEIAVLRYGHRFVRDYRVTSHCCLVARAFGAKKMIIAGDEDQSLKESISDSVKRWGGVFQIGFSENWKKTLTEHKKRGFFSIHLTMYGQPLQKEIKKLRSKKKVLMVIGSQKVEKEVYEQCDANIAVTGQPHSEIAALAVALDWLQNGKELKKRFKNAKIEVLPQKRGKKVKKQASV